MVGAEHDVVLFGPLRLRVLAVDLARAGQEELHVLAGVDQLAELPQEQLGRVDVGFDGVDRAVGRSIARRRPPPDDRPRRRRPPAGARAPRRPRCPWCSSAGDGSSTAARFSIEPVDSSSTTETRSPRAKSASTRWLPIKPAPPVTRQCRILKASRSSRGIREGDGR